MPLSFAISLLEKVIDCILHITLTDYTKTIVDDGGNRPDYDIKNLNGERNDKMLLIAVCIYFFVL